jgi:glucosylceramidase
MKLRLVLFSSCAVLFSSLSSNAQQARLWLTTPDRSALVAAQATSLHFSSEAGQLPVLTVDDSQRFQPMDGFGFALTGGSAQLLMRMGAAQRATLLKELFTSGADGIGVSYLRVSIGASDMNERVYSYDDLPAGETDVDMAKFSLGPDRADVIPVLKEILAIRPGIKILGSPWSAPAWIKTNNDVKGGELKPEYYAAYAKYFVKYIEEMRVEGIAIDAITIENEPLNPKNTPSLVMFAQQEDTFIAKYLGPAFEKAGIRTKILLYDHNPDVPSYPLSILQDPAASKYVDGTAFQILLRIRIVHLCQHARLTAVEVKGRPIHILARSRILHN